MAQTRDVGGRAVTAARKDAGQAAVAAQPTDPQATDPQATDPQATDPQATDPQATERAGDIGLGLNPLVGYGTTDFITGLAQLAERVVAEPAVTAQIGAALAQRLATAALGRSDLQPRPGDKRFADPLWDSNPFFRSLKQSYLAWSEAAEAWLGRSGLEGSNDARARIALGLLVDAAAPSNTLLGNPVALRKLLETGGGSVARGLGHMVDDLLANGGLPAQVDASKFKVGGNLALSSGAVVFTSDVLELIQYTPTTEQVHSRPLLIIPPQINKFYLYDLAPGRSLIEYLVAGGQQVFVVSWRNPSADQRHWNLETYIAALLEATEAVREVTGSADLNLNAACSGGITAALLLGHLAAKGDRQINAATLMVTVLDTSVESMMTSLATQETVQAARVASRRRGVLSGSELSRVFAWLRPNDLVWSYWVNNYLLGNDPPAFDVLFWNNDTTNLPAALHSDYLDLYLGNPLTRAGALTLLGTPIDLAKVACDSFIVAGVTDHITPWQACYATTHILGGRREFILSSSGHIQSVINPPGNKRAAFFRNADLPHEPDSWMAGATKQEGSWWPIWRDWLAERSGELRPASASLGSGSHPAGAKAPGTYVFAQA